MAGGHYYHERGHSVPLASTEILFKGGHSWVNVQSLPRELRYPASVSLGDSLLLLGNLYNILSRGRPIHLKPILTDTDSNQFWNF